MARLSAVCLTLVVLAGVGSARAEAFVRVRILASVAEVRLAGEALALDGQPLGAPATRARAAGEGALQVAGKTRSQAVRVSAARGVVVDGHWYPGGVSLVPAAGGGLDVVNVVPLEAYVARSVASEIYPNWPAEVLKAQAVVARTYALYEQQRKAGQPFHMEANVLSQRYLARSIPGPVERATEQTAGQYLAFQGVPILAAFHSSAGGRTASSAEVWGEAFPYLSPVSSPDDEAPDHYWSFEISPADLRGALEEHGYARQGPESVEVLERSESGRVLRVRLLGAELRGRDLREVLGGRAIRSTLFEVQTEGERVRFVGSGSGHGVGMSQWGARDLAEHGKRYPEILEHYYPQSELKRLQPGAVLQAREGRS